MSTHAANADAANTDSANADSANADSANADSANAANTADNADAGGTDTAAALGEQPTKDAAAALTVKRGGRSAVWSGAGSGVVIAVLAYLPFAVFTSTTQTVVTFFILVTMSSMWNLLAGYAGLVSVGQQAYVGLGAYAVLAFSDWGVQPYLGVLLAALACAAIAVPTSLLAFRLRGDYFAVGT